MATIGAIGTTSTAGLQANGLGMQDFLKILLTQLTYQDPMKPMDNQQFMAQMAQFTSLQQTQQLNERMDALLSTQAALQSVGLIGKTVDIATDSGLLSGIVQSLNLAGTNPELAIKKSDGTIIAGISLGQITAVR